MPHRSSISADLCGPRWDSVSITCTFRLSYRCQSFAEALKHKHHSNSVRSSFFRTLQRAHETRQTAGYMYEDWFHTVSAVRTIRSNWLQNSCGVENSLYRQCSYPQPGDISVSGEHQFGTQLTDQGVAEATRAATD